MRAFCPILLELRYNLKPNPVAALEWVNASHESMYGRIVCNWQLVGTNFRIEICIPVNCTVSLYLPEGYTSGITEGEKPVEESTGIYIKRNKGNRLVLELVSEEFIIGVNAE